MASCQMRTWPASKLDGVAALVVVLELFAIHGRVRDDIKVVRAGRVVARAEHQPEAAVGEVTAERRGARVAEPFDRRPHTPARDAAWVSGVREPSRTRSICVPGSSTAGSTYKGDLKLAPGCRGGSSILERATAHVLSRM